jgi:alpha-amylase
MTMAASALLSLVLLMVFAAVLAGEPTNPGNSFGRGPGETFVHLFEWSWDDIARECEEFLGPKGFQAVQISPPSEHEYGISWDARYRPVSFKLVSRSGNETQLASMIKRCKAVGVDIYADIVTNQFSGPNGGVGLAGTHFGYRKYDDLFGPDDFHHLPNDDTTNCGVDNYNDPYNVQYCDLMGMPDLCTGCPSVQDKVAAYVNKLHSLGVAGVRMDAAKHMNPDDMKGLMAKFSPDLYRFLEVFANFNEAVQPPQYLPPNAALGQVTCFAYAFNLDKHFQDPNSLNDDLFYFGPGKSPQDFSNNNGMLSEQAVVFIDNQDTQRADAPLTHTRWSVLYSMANVFMLAWPWGYPKLMSSYYFTDVQEGPPSLPVYGPHGTQRCGDGINWVCEHRWPQIANMVHFRKVVGSSKVTHWQTVSGNALSFCRGDNGKDKGCVAINKNSYDWLITLETDMPYGFYCDVSQSDESDCPHVEVGQDGRVKVNVRRMSTVAFHVGKRPAAKPTTLSWVATGISIGITCLASCLIAFACYTLYRRTSQREDRGSAYQALVA